uniref:FHA domain-containing protein n=1 Tax=Timema cristinae TaxID=61476 RepID=A0A7R9GQ00_TIMCR|nr:unnamed protein product [Timema cristinae]
MLNKKQQVEVITARLQIVHLILMHRCKLYQQLNIIFIFPLLQNDPTELPTVILVDCGSKYGTFLQDNVKLAANTEVALKDGSVIKFGVQWNVWTLVHVPLVVTASTLNSEEKKLMSQTVAALGGHVVPRWQDCCTHVTMKQVVCALALGCPIVTPKFWDNYLSSVSSKTTLPDYLDFIPPLAEVSLNNSNSSDEALLLQESNILPPSLCKDESSLDSDNSCPIRLSRRRTRAAVIVDETSSELTDTLSMEADSNTMHNSDKLTTNILPDVKRRKVEVSKSDIPVPDTRKRSRSPEEIKLSPKRLATNPPLFEMKKNDVPFTSKKDIPSKVVLNKAHHSKIINREQSDNSEKYDFSFREDQPKKSARNPLSTAKRVSLININRCDDFEDDDDNMFNFVGESRKTSAKKSNSIKKREISSIADEEDEICPQRKKRFTEESMWQHSISLDRSTTLNDTISLEGFVSVMKIKAKDIAPVRSSVVPIIIGGRDLEAGAGNLENGFHDDTVKQEFKEEDEEENDENNFEFNQSSQNL